VVDGAIREEYRETMYLVVSRYDAEVELSESDYRRLLEFRTELRRFLSWSEAQAVAAGITPAQHQLLLAVRGHPDPRGPTVGDVADYLLLRHHSTVELIDRAEAAHLVRRVHDDDDGRVVRLQVTASAKRVLAHLAAGHLEELGRLAPRIQGLYEGLGPAGDENDRARTPSRDQTRRR
jgi:DNA-binding MarR family transcriptional regulator